MSILIFVIQAEFNKNKVYKNKYTYIVAFLEAAALLTTQKALNIIYRQAIIIINSRKQSLNLIL